MNNLILQKNIPKSYAFLKYSWIVINWIRILVFGRFLWIHYVWFIYFMKWNLVHQMKILSTQLLYFYKIVLRMKLILFISDLFFADVITNYNIISESWFQIESIYHIHCGYGWNWLSRIGISIYFALWCRKYE